MYCGLFFATSPVPSSVLAKRATNLTLSIDVLEAMQALFIHFCSGFVALGWMGYSFADIDYSYFDDLYFAVQGR